MTNLFRLRVITLELWARTNPFTQLKLSVPRLRRYTFFLKPPGDAKCLIRIGILFAEQGQSQSACDNRSACYSCFIPQREKTGQVGSEWSRVSERWGDGDCLCQEGSHCMRRWIYFLNFSLERVTHFRSGSFQTPQILELSGKYLLSVPK